MSGSSLSLKRSNSQAFKSAVRFALYVLAGIEGVSLGIGLGREVWGTGGSSLVLPLVAAPGFAILAGVGWHIVSQMAVDAKTWLDRTFTFGAGGLLSGFGITFSGAYLLVLIAGNPAMQQGESVQLGHAEATLQIVISNAALENGITGPAKAAQENLKNLAAREAKGTGITNLEGPRRVYGELMGGHSAVGNWLDAFAGIGTARQEHLAAAQADLQAAKAASAAYDHAGFQGAMAAFAVHLRAADSIQPPSLAGIAAGLMSGNARQLIDDTIRTLRDILGGITQKRRAIVLEPYRPLNAMQAVFAYPQPVQIAICLSLELVGWLLVCLLMMLPHKPDEEPQPETVNSRASGPLASQAVQNPAGLGAAPQIQPAE